MLTLLSEDPDYHQEYEEFLSICNVPLLKTNLYVDKFIHLTHLEFEFNRSDGGCYNYWPRWNTLIYLSINNKSENNGIHLDLSRCPQIQTIITNNANISNFELLPLIELNVTDGIICSKLPKTLQKIYCNNTYIDHYDMTHLTNLTSVTLIGDYDKAVLPSNVHVNRFATIEEYKSH
jgi:hypothetical protein